MRSGPDQIAPRDRSLGERFLLDLAGSFMGNAELGANGLQRGAPSIAQLDHLTLMFTKSRARGLNEGGSGFPSATRHKARWRGVAVSSPNSGEVHVHQELLEGDTAGGGTSGRRGSGRTAGPCGMEPGLAPDSALPHSAAIGDQSVSKMSPRPGLIRGDSKAIPWTAATTETRESFEHAFAPSGSSSCTWAYSRMRYAELVLDLTAESLRRSLVRATVITRQTSKRGTLLRLEPAQWVARHAFPTEKWTAPVLRGRQGGPGAPNVGLSSGSRRERGGRGVVRHASLCT
jgi:hypothetical protein